MRGGCPQQCPRPRTSRRLTQHRLLLPQSTPPGSRRRYAHPPRLERHHSSRMRLSMVSPSPRLPPHAALRHSLERPSPDALPPLPSLSLSRGGGRRSAAAAWWASWRGCSRCCCWRRSRRTRHCCCRLHPASSAARWRTGPPPCSHTIKAACASRCPHAAGTPSVSSCWTTGPSTRRRRCCCCTGSAARPTRAPRRHRTPTGVKRHSVFSRGVRANARWRKLAPLLASRGLRVVAVDMPGSGLSDKPAGEDYTPDALAGVVAAAAHVLGLQPAHVVRAPCTHPLAPLS
jgi:hypothetical protein